MPVTTSGLSEKTEDPLPGVKEDATMETKEPTIQDVLNSIKNMELRLDAKMDEQVKILKTNQEASDKKIEGKINNIEKGLSNHSDEMSLLQKKSDRQQATITKLEARIKSMERKQKSHNMLIEGLKEKNNENLRLIVDEMLEDMEISFNVEWIDCIYRVGTKRNNSDRRPVMLNFPFLSYKHEIFRNVYKLHDMKKWKGVYLQDDLSMSEQLKKKETRAIYVFAKSQGMDVKMRGNNLIIDGIKYSQDDELPHNLLIEKAKTVKVKDGVAFQGKHAPYSNLHPCQFKFEGRDHTSSEQALQYKNVTVCKQDHVARKIMETDEPYDIMGLASKLGDNEEWNRECVTHLKPILKAKFDQNPHLKAKLMAEKGHFYEATTHPVFGAGLTLAQSQQICKANVTTGNKPGDELELLRDFYIQQEVNKNGDVGQ